MDPIQNDGSIRHLLEFMGLVSIDGSQLGTITCGVYRETKIWNDTFLLSSCGGLRFLHARSVTRPQIRLRTL